MFESLNERMSFVKELTEYVYNNFSNRFNIFVFGSFLTDKFIPGRSDLDIAIYTDGDFLDLDCVVADFIGDKIEYDTIWINPASRVNFIDINALAGYRCNDWFPDELRTHLSQLVFAQMEDMDWRIAYKNRLIKAVRTY